MTAIDDVLRRSFVTITQSSSSSSSSSASFESLGLNPHVASAMGFPEPTRIQELGIPAVLQDTMDVVIARQETKHGKKDRTVPPPREGLGGYGGYGVTGLRGYGVRG